MELSGTIKKFSGKGRDLGYPTANIEVDSDTPEGLFVGSTRVKGKNWPSIIFIGIPVTVGDRIKRAEAHILDFPDQDLYGEPIKLSIEKKLRDNKKFDTVEDLKQQMKKDETQAKQYFNMVSSK